MLLGLFKYLKFLINSSNQHGVHSPFVYNFITQSIYTKTRYKGNKVIDVLLKSVDYFEAKVILLPKEDIVLKDLIQKNSPKMAFQGKPYDIIYLKYPNEVSQHEFSPSKNRVVHNDSMLLINSIHKNKKTETYWENIKKWEHVTVTLDFFYCGAVFFRKEQAEEHFKIRI